MRRICAASLVMLSIVVSACTPTAPGASPSPAGQDPTAGPTPAVPVFTPHATPSPAQPTKLPAPVRVRLPFPDPVLQAPFAEEVAVAGGVIWIERYSEDYQLLRFDPVSERITATVQLDYPVALMTADDGSLWAVGPWGGAPGPRAYTVSRINLTTGRLRTVAEVPVGGVAVGFGSIWLGTYEHLIRIDRATGERLQRWDLVADRVQIACGAVWTWDLDGGMNRLDPLTGAITSYGSSNSEVGEGPVYDRDGECWRRVENGVERLWPGPTMTTGGPPPPASWIHGSTFWFEGSTFWYRPEGAMQRWDPSTGTGTGTMWTLDKRDVSSYWKVGDDGLVLSAGGSVWLVNGFEIVGFDIPAD